MSLKVNQEGNQFNVLQIHGVKKEKGRNLYLVEWEGFPKKDEYTWEPHKNLKDCFVFHKFLSEKREKKRKREDRGILVKDIFKKTKRDSLTKDERFDLIRSQKYKCNLCLNPFGSSSFEIDHIIPLEQGGTNDMANLQGLCDSCHIFKTTVLDRGVIVRLLQAKLQNKNSSNISRKQILEECQMVYFNRNRNRIPFHEEEMLNFCITTVDIYREMCKKEVKKRVTDIMKINKNMEDSKIELKISDASDNKKSQPPKPKGNDPDNGRKSTYLNNLLSIIKKLVLLQISSNVLHMKHFTLSISISLEKDMKNDDEIYDGLNNFFKEIYLKKPDELKTCIGNVNIFYKKK